MSEARRGLPLLADAASDKDALTLATIKALGFNRIDVHCPRCRVIRVRPWRIVPDTTTWGSLKARLKCQKCGGRPSAGSAKPRRPLSTAGRDAADRDIEW